MPGRIIFSNATPNDKDGIIPNDKIDFSRFNKNPVILREHIWGVDPLGMWTDLKIEGGNWTGIPVFHGLTEESREAQKLYEGGWLRAASIGGFAVWEENAAGQYKLINGNKICSKFFLYEISLVTLPSNEDAVQMEPLALMAKYADKFASHIYETPQRQMVEDAITTLSSKYQNSNMKTPEEIAAEKALKEKQEKEAAEKQVAEAAKLSADPKVKEARANLEKAEREAAEKLAAQQHQPTELSAGLPKWLKEIVSLGGRISLGAPAPENTPKTEPASDKPLHVEQPNPIGLKGAKEKEEMENAAKECETANTALATAKAESEKEGASDDMKAGYESALAKANQCMAAYEAAEAKYKAAADADGGDSEEIKAKKEKEKAKKEKENNAAGGKPAAQSQKPVMKTKEELKTELKLASKPTRVRLGDSSNGATFTKLTAKDNKDGRAILNRVMCSDAGEKNLEDYAIVLNSIMQDSRLTAIRDNMRIVMNANSHNLGNLRMDQNQRQGVELKTIQANLNAGRVEILDRESNQLRQMTTLSSTDNALASPALNTIEWLPLAIFQLFPTNSWKNEIPMFSAQMSGANTGFIWANISAAPLISKGAQPATNQAAYIYGDTSVALSLTPYWMQPILWTPLTMHQLRYDMMGTGWAQAFALMNATIDDELLYTLAQSVPGGSIVNSSGLSGYQTQPLQIAINGTTNSFYWNPTFTGNLIAPTLNDIISIEQIFNAQNFQLEQQKVCMVIDPIQDAAFSRDPEAKSLLTRWVNADGADLLAFKHTVLHQRSRVALWDPATTAVKDPAGVIPATAQSAGLAFVPSQIGIGVGMLDVFFVQAPGAYGYEMSADLRMGIAALRANANGLALFNYAPGNV